MPPETVQADAVFKAFKLKKMFKLAMAKAFHTSTATASSIRAASNTLTTVEIDCSYGSSVSRLHFAYVEHQVNEDFQAFGYREKQIGTLVSTSPETP